MIKAVDINKPVVDQLTIDTLTDLLEKAKSGELVSLIYVDLYTDKLSGWGWSGAPNAQMIGKMEELKFSLLSQVLAAEESQ